MQHQGHAQQPGREHGRKGGISAETGPHVGPEAADDPHGPAHGGRHAQGCAHGPPAAPQQAAHRQALKGHTGQTRQTRLRPVERPHKEQLGLRVATAQFLGHGQGGKDVPARAAGRQKYPVHGASAVREKFISSPTQSMVASKLLPP